MDIKENKGYQYAKLAACMKKGGKVPIYVIKQAKAWVKIADGKSKKAYVDTDELERIDSILGLMVHPDLGVKMNEGLEPYAMWFIVAMFCTKRKNDDTKLYTTAVLEIARKNFKTFTSAVIFIIALLLEPRFSRLFSVAPEFKLSNELRLAVRKIIKCSPLLADHFRVCRDYVSCTITDNEYMPLAYSNDRLDGRLAAVWLADEAAAMGSYPIEAMRSSQITLKNKLGIIISTQYPNEHNGFLDEVDAAKQVLNGLLDDESRFALLYEPDENIRSQWADNDMVIYQSNPVAVTNPKIFTEIVKLRQMAVLYANKRENFLCKHVNIQHKSLGTESYIDIDTVRKCRIDKNDSIWQGKAVYLGADLSQTDDNTSVAQVFYDRDEDIIYARVTGFIPDERRDEKSILEKFDYNAAISRGDCFGCGDTIIDYSFVEGYILNIARSLDCAVMGAGFDRYNAMSTMQKLENADEPVSCTEVKQHSSVLHPATKLLREYILSGRFRYEDNLLLENSFENARCQEDTNLNKYVTKKKSKGKVDMVVALINAVYMLIQCELLGQEEIFVG